MNAIPFIKAHILLIMILLPLMGVIYIMFIPEYYIQRIKIVGLMSSIITFMFSLFLWKEFNNTLPEFQFVDKFSYKIFFPKENVLFSWLPDTHLQFILGIDGISLLFILLTTFLIPLCLLIGWDSIKNNIKEYGIAFLMTEVILLIVFCALELISFFIFFESILIPMFLIIGWWGARERKIHAAYQFFLYTLFGSMFMLLAILSMNTQNSLDFLTLYTEKTKFNYELILWLAFFFAFSIKVPLIPFHIWLPEAHVEAPTAGSVLLAGVLLKLGTYGLLRTVIPLFQVASTYYLPLIYILSLLGIVYASLTTLRQIDLKKIIAYASIGHMGFVILGLFSQNVQAIEGSIVIMISHGLVSSALFLCIGMLYDRHKTRIIKYYRGMALIMPMFSSLFLFLNLANMSLPGTSNFVGEFLILAGSFMMNPTAVVLASLGIVLGAAYVMWLYNRVTFGETTRYFHKFNDINKKELFVLIPLIFLIIYLGISPDILIETIHVSVEQLLKNY